MVVKPVIGGLVSLAYAFSEKALAIYLGFFAGFTAYICASNINPKTHAARSPRKNLALTITGAVLMFTVTRFI